ncbi:M48 family metalloprotease [Patescibacteria group bacterium]|nr:M48 family metalloprotease [Patescibacteria group bacterium]MBU1034695.1 M48 family metalloprotease [Patescibacteria group bacterium]MBU1630041.1 M48 family metalloprotease [Patescibacteria group bacterium]MBU1907657.1 M48 family metalloprotease [Patescibacteria group bacterium]
MYSQIDSNRRKSWLLIFIFIGLLTAAGWIYGYVLSDAGPSALIIALCISLGMTLISWYAGDKIALSTTGAQELTQRNQFPTLWNVVENLAITAGIPRPRIYIIEDESPNAFATGRDPVHASVAVTTGLLRRLEKVELEGVLAHELGHVKNMDIRLMMLVIVLVGTLTIMGDYFLHFGLGRRRDKEQGGPIILIGIAFMVLAPLIGQLIKLAISRKREYLADASGALLTRYPEGLARALEKIRDTAIPMQRTSSATNHLWISEPQAQGGFSQKISALFSTHPPINERIIKLRQM